MRARSDRPRQHESTVFKPSTVRRQAFHTSLSCSGLCRSLSTPSPKTDTRDTRGMSSTPHVTNRLANCSPGREQPWGTFLCKASLTSLPHIPSHNRQEEQSDLVRNRFWGPSVWVRAVWPWASSFTSLCLNFPTCKTRLNCWEALGSSQMELSRQTWWPQIFGWGMEK